MKVHGPLAAAASLAGAVLAQALATSSCMAAGISATVRLAGGQPVADAVVVAVPQATARRAPPAAAEIVDQVDYEFVPKVKPVYVGSSVRFPNKDNARHHVYSFSAAKRFDLPLYAGTPAAAVLFDKPGVVVLGCNIHDWMIGYIYVSESPFFAKTDAGGNARIEDLPPGHYQVRVWQPNLDGPETATARPVDLQGSRVAELAWEVKLRPEVRVRRAPMAGSHNHY
jgi:plastocyanin